MPLSPRNSFSHDRVDRFTRAEGERAEFFRNRSRSDTDRHGVGANAVLSSVRSPFGEAAPTSGQPAAPGASAARLLAALVVGAAVTFCVLSFRSSRRPVSSDADSTTRPVASEQSGDIPRTLAVPDAVPIASGGRRGDLIDEPRATERPHRRDAHIQLVSAEETDLDRRGDVGPAADVWPAEQVMSERRRRAAALGLLRKARASLSRGELRNAWCLAAEAEQIDARLEALDDRPNLVRRDVERVAEEARIRLAAEERVSREPDPIPSPGASAEPRSLALQEPPAPGISPAAPTAMPVRNGFLRAESPADPRFLRSPELDPAPRLSFQFHQAPWDLVLRRFAEEAGLSLHMDAAPPGALTYFDLREYSPVEVQDLLNGFLIPRGFLLVRRDRALAVVEISKGLPAGLFPEVHENDIDRFGLNEVFTVWFTVPHAPAARAARDLRVFLSPLGTMTPLDHSNRLVVTDTGRSLRRIREVLAFEPNDPQRCVSSVHALRNTKAVEVAKAITDFLGRGAPPMTPAAPQDHHLPPIPVIDPLIMVVAEPTTNSLLVSAPPDRIGEIQSLIERLDSAPAEVLIQALLVEVELGNVDELGVELGVQDSILFDRSVVNNVLTVTESVANPVSGVVTSSQKIISQTATPGFNFNGQALGNNVSVHPSKVGTQGGSTLGVGRINGDLGYGGMVLSAGSESINVLIRALSEKRKVDILSRPQIRTIDNRPAEIQIGQQVPVVDGVSVTAVGSANPVIRQDKAGIILTVTPHIRNDGHVVIDVTAEKSQFNLAKGAGVPIFTDATNGNVIEAPVKDITQARTSVSCLGGQTIVLGGMITKSQVDVKRKVPYLGDIPYLGVAFRYTLDETRRRELLIFLTPHVIRDPLGDSERLKHEEVARTHYPLASSLQMHGDVLAPPPNELAGERSGGPESYPERTLDGPPGDWSPGEPALYGPVRGGQDGRFVPPAPSPPADQSSRTSGRPMNGPSSNSPTSTDDRAQRIPTPRGTTAVNPSGPAGVIGASGLESPPLPRAASDSSAGESRTSTTPAIPPANNPRDSRPRKIVPWKPWRSGKSE